MTFDNDKEFAGFKELERGLDMRSYFARPYHSWERKKRKAESEKCKIVRVQLWVGRK